MVQLHVTQTCVWYNPQYRINLVSTTNCIGTAFNRKENITLLFLCRKLNDCLNQMKEKKKLRSWDWIPKWDAATAVSEDLQEQGKYDMGQQPQKLRQQYLSMLEGGESIYAQC